MTRREKLQGAAFILCLLSPVVIDVSLLAAGMLVAAAGVLVYISYRVRR
ncbi:MAG: hypothetical protein ACERKO_09485 [Acetanaerobacterium sp.]